MNFVVANQASSQEGQVSQRDEPVVDAKIYVNAFDKIEGCDIREIVVAMTAPIRRDSSAR